MNRLRIVSSVIIVLTLISTFVVIVITAGEFLTGGTDIFPTLAASLALIVMTSAFAINVYGRTNKVNRHRLQIALAGPPGVGKTSFINVAYGLLMEGHAKSLSFTSETKTAHSVYNAIGRLGQGRWPTPTTTDGLSLYRGSVRRRDPALLGTLMRGLIEVDLEIADSAGELWEDLSKEARKERPKQLVDSTFFDYVAKSDSLFYFIDSNAVLLAPSDVRSSVDDLLVTIQLLRAMGGNDPFLSMPITVIISKADLLSDMQDRALRELFAPGEFSREASLSDEEDPLFTESISHLERLVSVLPKLTKRVTFYRLSSKSAAIEGRLADDLDSSDRILLSSRQETQMLKVGNAVDALLAPIVASISHS
jgi:hypothetical protein